MNWTPELREKRRIERHAAYVMALYSYPEDEARKHVDRLYPEPPPELTYSQGVCGNFGNYFRRYYRRNDGKWFYTPHSSHHIMCNATFLSDEIVLNLAKLVPQRNEDRDE